MNNHVAVFTDDSQIFDELKKSAEASTFILHQNPQLSEYLDKFIICDLASFQSLEKSLGQIKRELLILISEKDDESNMQLVDTNGLHHLVGLNAQTFGSEVICSLEKISSRKIWGVKPYLGEEADVKIISLSDSKHTNEMITEALNHFDFQDYFSSPTEYLQVMANELISNSLYKGPNRKRAEQGLETPDRKSPVFLKGSDLVQVTLGMSDKGIALSVQDSFGGLNYNLLIESLRRSFREKTVMEKKDGAGLGLYLTFLHSNQFIINYRENFRTEVICIIDKNKRYKNYKQRIRSFHFFQEVSGEKTND